MAVFAIDWMVCYIWPQRMNPGDPLTFPVVPPGGQILIHEICCAFLWHTEFTIVHKIYLKIWKATFKLVPYKGCRRYWEINKTHTCTTFRAVKCCAYCMIELTVLFIFLLRKVSKLNWNPSIFYLSIIKFMGMFAEASWLCVISKERCIWAMKRLVVAVLVRYY